MLFFSTVTFVSVLRVGEAARRLGWLWSGPHLGDGVCPAAPLSNSATSSARVGRGGKWGAGEKGSRRTACGKQGDGEFGREREYYSYVVARSNARVVCIGLFAEDDTAYRHISLLFLHPISTHINSYPPSSSTPYRHRIICIGLFSFDYLHRIICIGLFVLDYLHMLICIWLFAL
jgi:hypothetical protein